MDIWPRVDELIGRAETVTDLYAHRVHLYAAWRRRSLGRPVSPELIELERGAAIMRLAAPGLLDRIRRAHDGVMVLLKGAQAAEGYPKPELRPYNDLDLLVPDAEAVQLALLDAGFREYETEEPHGHHHLRALEWPGLPMLIEIHSEPSWPTWITPPATSDLFAAATTECVLGHGVLALPTAHHALLLMAHVWREAPLSRLGHLIDIAVTLERTEPGEIERLAQRWGVERLWSSTAAAVDAVLLGTPEPSHVARIWLKDIEAVRERSVIGQKLAQLLAPFWGLSFPKAVGATFASILAALRPARDETWRAMLRRNVSALKHSFQRRSARDRKLHAERKHEL